MRVNLNQILSERKTNENIHSKTGAKINSYMIGGDAAIFRLVSFFLCGFIFIVTFLHICFFFSSFSLLFLYAHSVTECVVVCVCKKGIKEA